MRKEMIMRMLMTMSLVLLTGLSALSWINTLDEDLTWIYYNDNGRYKDMIVKGIYEMAFVDSVEIDARMYKEFKVTQAALEPIYGYTGIDIVYFGMASSGYFFRESEGKIWTRDGYYPGDENGEFLIYDFSAKDNDPFPGSVEEDNVVCLPDTILEKDNRPRKMYTSFYGTPPASDYPTLRCIEGIGTTRGFLCEIWLLFRAGATPLDISGEYPGSFDCVLVGVRNKAGEYIYGARHPMEDLFAGVSGVEADDDTAPRYFNLQGLPVESPKTGDIIIKVTGNRTEKTVWK